MNREPDNLSSYNYLIIPKYDLIPQSCALNLILWPWNVYPACPACPVGMEYRTGGECDTYSSGVGVKYRTGACPALYSES